MREADGRGLEKVVLTSGLRIRSGQRGGDDVKWLRNGKSREAYMRCA